MFRKALLIGKSTIFRKFFFSYSLLILVPLAAFGILLYHYSMEVVTNETVKSTAAIMENFSSEVEEFLSLLTDDTIAMLAQSPVSGLMTSEVRFKDLPPNEMHATLQEIREIQADLNSIINTKRIIDDIYIVYLQNGSVLRYDGLYDAEIFFGNIHTLAQQDSDAFLQSLTSRQTMAFYEPQTVSTTEFTTFDVISSRVLIPIVTTYPFNSAPSIAMVSDLRVDWLSERIAVDGIDTYIIDRRGNVIVHAGALSLTGEMLSPVLGKAVDGEVLRIGQEDYRVSNLVSATNEWNYVSVIRERDFTGPADSIRATTLLLLSSLLVLGFVVSYAISYRMYTPIRSIARQVNSEGEPLSQRVNEYDYLSDWYHRTARDSRRMQHLIEAMRPALLENALLQILQGASDCFDCLNGYIEPGAEPFSSQSEKLVLCIELLPLGKAPLHIGLVKRKLANEIMALGRRIWMTDVSESRLAVVWENAEHCRIEDILAALEDAFEQKGPVKHVCAVSGRFDSSARDLSESYFFALKLLEYRLFNSANEIITEQIAEERMYADTYLSESIVNKLRSAKDAQELFKVIEDILQQQNTEVCVEKHVRLIALDILNTMMRSTGKADGNLEKTMGYIAQLEACRQMDELQEAFRGICANEYDTLSQEESLPQNKTIELAMAYIREHYAADLSLEFFADRYHMSVGHFSRCFKRYSGDKYVDFLNHCRIERAKLLLNTTDLIIDEIAVQVGYMGGNSFNAIFKRYEGITPGRYRALSK